MISSQEQCLKCAYLTPLHHHVCVRLTLRLILVALPEEMLIERKDFRRPHLIIVSVITRGEGRELW